MPYVSKKQQAFFHTDAAKNAGITDSMVKEYDDASKGLNLPTRVHKKKLNPFSDKAFVKYAKDRSHG